MKQSFFKDILEQEIRSVFLNPAEFGDMIELEGRTLPALVDPLEMQWPDTQTDTRPVSYEWVELRVSLEGFPDRLWQGKPLTFNGETWHVGASDRADLRCIRLYRECGR